MKNGLLVLLLLPLPLPLKMTSAGFFKFDTAVGNNCNISLLFSSTVMHCPLMLFIVRLSLSNTEGCNGCESSGERNDRDGVVEM